MTKTNKGIEAIVADLKQLFDEYGIDYEKFHLAIDIRKETISPYLPKLERVKNYKGDDWIIGIIRSRHPTPPSQLKD